MIEFKAGDLVYYPEQSDEIHKLHKRNEFSAGVYFLTIVHNHIRGANFTDDGRRFLSDVGQRIFHATQENYELLSKLYPNVEFEPPPKRKEPIDVITAMLEGGYNEVCLKAPIVGYEIVGNPTHARNACHAVKRFKPYCLKKGKYIVDFIDGKCVLEDGEVVFEG